MTDQLQVRIQSATRQYEASATKKLLSKESSLKVYKSSQKGMANAASGKIKTNKQTNKKNVYLAPVVQR